MKQLDKNIKKINFKKERTVIDLTIEEYLSLDAVPMQRDTESRAKKHKTDKMLKKLSPVHLDVSLVQLMKDSEYYGVLYKKNTRFIVNGNTRKFYWENGLTDFIPEYVSAVVYYVDSMEEVRQIYNTYDSPDATEKTQEKFYGILSGVYKYQPVFSKVQKGEILTSLYYACHLLDPAKYSITDKTPKEELLRFFIGEYLEEIKVFDKLAKLPKQWDAALSCAALMILKRYGNEPRAIDFLKKVEDRVIDTSQVQQDGVTHVSVEWDKRGGIKFPVRRAAIDSKPGGLPQTVPYILYWCEKYIADKKQTQLGSGWDKTHTNWFNQYNYMNKFLNNALLVTENEPENEPV